MLGPDTPKEYPPGTLLDPWGQEANGPWDCPLWWATYDPGE